MIHGNKEGIRDSLLSQMEALYDLDLGAEVFAPAELLEVLAQFTSAINREISIYVSRSGAILDVTIGSLGSVELKDMRLRRNARRLSMVRCIHTHPGGNPQLSDVDISSLRSMRFDAMAAVGVLSGRPTGMQAAFLGEAVGGVSKVNLTGVLPINKLPQRMLMDAIAQADREVLIGEPAGTEEVKERAYLVGLDSERSLEELARLADTAGAVVVGSMLQKKTRPDTATYIGSGKAEELSLDCQAKEADIAIFDDELSGVQIRNLEELLRGVKVLDRTALILDIFAQRAQSREGRLQVELAQMAYQLPRLTGHGIAMSRLGGGIGTRGPGETRLELDRRRIRRRMSDLRREIDELSSQRELRRSRREKNKAPVVALVGYTNAGKSTLLNTLSGAGVLAEDKLFATLDPVVRTVKCPGGGEFLLVDTVGFISKLPHALVDAFRSTLEEALLADVLLIVSDGASGELERQHDVVLEVLRSLGAGDKVKIDVINKVDLLEETPQWPGAVAVSAKTGEGMDELLKEIHRKLHGIQKPIRVEIPYAQGGLIALLHEEASVTRETYTDKGIELEALASEEVVSRLAAKLGAGAIVPLEADSLERKD
ncbi:MAG: GTPase HflX [Clostridia bacterium]|nr:GTPase HflX [Clostridia bacterium]